MEDMGSQFWLYWSNIEAYEACPRKFLWSRGYGNIDLGRGPGRSKEKPVRSSRHDAMMGLVIGTAIERLYNDELWREPKALVSKLTEIVQREFKFALNDNYIDWGRSPPKDQLLETCMNGVMGFLRTMKVNRLLGPYAKSEVDITTWVDKYTPIGGRPDVIIRRDDTGLMIVDGKNSKNPGLYTDPDQLRWYALCFYLAYNTVPDRLAFCYFRYPEGSPPPDHDPNVPWKGLVEVPLEKDDLKTLAVRAKETYRAMGKELFDPTPSPKTCKFCDYESVCDARQEQKAGNRRGPKKTEEDDLLGGSSGFVEIGFVDEDKLTRKKK